MAVHVDAVLQVTAEMSNLKRVRDFVTATAEQMSVDADATADLVLAVDELVTNIIKYGYLGQAGPIEIAIHRAGEDVIIHLRDRAPGFDPTRVPPPDVTRPLDERPLGGMGIYLARTVVDDMTYQAGDGNGNEVTLIKRHSIPHPHGGAK